MAAESNSTESRVKPFKHMKYDWGELWCGTKQQLQAAGFALDAVFPGEEGGPVRRMTVRDVSGRKVEIRKEFRSEGPDYYYEASRHYLDDAAALKAWRLSLTTTYAPGVACYSGNVRSDEFKGTAQSLVAAGLIENGQLPGQPGRGKMMVTYDAQGAQAGTTVGIKPFVGYKSIKRVGANRYVIEVQLLDEAESLRRKHRTDLLYADRRRAFVAAREEFEHQLFQASVPALLPAARSHLKLVWSRP